MTQKVLILIMLFILPFTMQAQFGKDLLHKAKSKVNQRINNKTDKAMDDALDEVERKNGNSKSSNGGEDKKGNKDTATPSLTSYSKFDFVPGDKIVYTEDFAQDEIGELPIGWNTNNRGEVVKVEGFNNNWLRLIGGSSYLAGSKDTFSRNFTVEFDLLYKKPEPNGYGLPKVQFGILSTGKKDSPVDNKFLKYPTSYAFGKVDLTISPEGKGYTPMYNARLSSFVDMTESFTSEPKNVDDLKKYANKVSHVAIQVQGTRFRCWINDFKLFDLPMALSTKHVYNQLFFGLDQSLYKEEELGYYIGNIKVAAGKPDTRHKFMQEGKFSTTGILFALNSADIKPESYGVIKEMATVLKENAGVRVKVVGHTSNDGDDATNMKLSEKRAEAVKATLVKEFSIDAARIETAGKGETQPVANNKTKEGQMQNRRVEFIKL